MKFFAYQGGIAQWLKLIHPGLALIRCFTSQGSFEQLVFIDELEPLEGDNPSLS